MEWIERLRQAVNYVEKNLTEEISTLEVAQQANCSTFHFQRSFSLITGITLSEYIRRRKLTKAAGEILEGESILDTAIKFGYESQASFTRAFSKMHGFSPGMTREPGMTLKAFPPITFQFSIEGVNSMDYEIKTLEGFKVAGKIRKFTTKDDLNFKEIPEFWQEELTSGEAERIGQKAGEKGPLGKCHLGVCMDFEEKSEEFNYMIGISPDPGTDLGDLVTREVPASTWAIFKGRGQMPDAMQGLFKRIYKEWFPATNYTHADTPEMEVYRPNEPGSDDCIFEIWIPVKSK